MTHSPVAKHLQFSKEAPKRFLDRGSFSTSLDVGADSADYKSSLGGGVKPFAPSLKLGPAFGAAFPALDVGPIFSEREKTKLKQFAIAVGLTPFAVGGLLACIVI